MADLWEVINDGQVEAWGSTRNDDRKGELNPGDVIDILDAYPEGDPQWLQFEIEKGGVDLDPHATSPYNQYWVKRDEIKLQRPSSEPDVPEEPDPPPLTGAPTAAEAGAALGTLLDFIKARLR